MSQMTQAMDLEEACCPPEITDPITGNRYRFDFRPHVRLVYVNDQSASLEFWDQVASQDITDRGPFTMKYDESKKMTYFTRVD